MHTRDLYRLKDQVAIITGGCQWLGYDMACALAENGANIIITSRQRKKAEEAARKITEAYGVEAIGLELDQREYDSVEKMAKEAYAFKGHIDILINNAGGGSGNSEGNLFQRKPEHIVDMIHTNLTGALFCCKAVGRYMAEQEKGKIINLASIAGIVGRDRQLYRNTNKMEQPVDYAAAKAGIIGLTRDLAAFMAPYNVQVNCISPGGFDKGDLPQDFVKGYAELTPMRRMGEFKQDIKGIALFLASGASAYVTGQNMVVDGGFSTCK